MNFRVHSLLYFGAGILFILLETLGIVYPGILVKALIMPILIWLYRRFIKGRANRFHRMIIIALFFSWVGDLTLQLAGFSEDFFLAGLISFLIAQLVYMAAFLSIKGPSILLTRKAYLAIPVVLYGVLILWLLWDGLGDMLIPVIAYCMVIMAMVLAAINRKMKVNPQSYQLVLLGAVIFVLSDSILAINKFKQPFELARVASMTSYITAQYLIAIGCIRQYNLTLENNPG
jgi:uncharacterized membrane protein YhhN